MGLAAPTTLTLSWLGGSSALNLYNLLACRKEACHWHTHHPQNRLPPLRSAGITMRTAVDTATVGTFTFAWSVRGSIQPCSARGICRRQ